MSNRELCLEFNFNRLHKKKKLKKIADLVNKAIFNSASYTPSFLHEADKTIDTYHQVVKTKMPNDLIIDIVRDILPRNGKTVTKHNTDITTIYGNGTEEQMPIIKFSIQDIG